MENIITDKNGHRERLRRRFRDGGIKSLSDYELLELLLTYSIPRKDVKPIAKSLLKKFGTISAIFNADEDQLISVKGIGEKSIALIKLIHACHIKHFEDKMLSSNPLSNPEDVVNFSRVFLANRIEENLMVLFLNSKNKIIAYKIMDEGDIDHAVVYQRKILKKAIEKSSNSIIIIHNHPSGETNPSQEDIDITRRMKNTLQELNIRLIDHIIIGKSTYFSFLEKGIL
ncbi:MAG TPA: DNA repair protein RadC [Victivallales bacterium]|nr:DNA repair protein RadC [Victivallales bacterium]HRR28641.1 DNA repair protein RadC [Victivallales bacterium]HRU01896.1 DNA repair protein RadC [Victivallales bacterium]